MKYKGYVLDPFQEQAIKALERGDSVLVSAPTGTGKTLIADYLIDRMIKKDKRVIYTSPIKALSNQKYREFSQAYPNMIGLLTGDVSINPKAPILIMTTEIYRNMLLTHDAMVEQIAYVIFDEIHFINDFDRGTVWEEAIIFSPEHVRFLGLSATIPNADEFAAWIASVKQHHVEVIEHHHRAVPLEHYFYHHKLEPITPKTVKQMKYLAHIDGAVLMKARGRKKGRRQPMQRDSKLKQDLKIIIDLLHHLNEEDLLPLLYFSFSRKDTEVLAKAIKKSFPPFASPEERKQLIQLARKRLTGDIIHLQSTETLRQLLSYGIGYHHAGMLPQQKELVEEAFALGLLKVLFVTETFALGVNMPARTVAFHSLRKWDGRSFRFINGKEYFQMAGRAGRRGIDEKGYVIVPLTSNTRNSIDYVFQLLENPLEPIESQYKLSYNTAINLIRQHTPEEIEEILKKSFYHFQQQENHNIKRSFVAYKKRLQKLGYLDENDTLTRKGLLLSHIYTNELAIAEAITQPQFLEFTPLAITLVLGTLVYEPKPRTKFFVKKPQEGKLLKQLMNFFESNLVLRKKEYARNLKHIFPLLYSWFVDEDFEKLLQMTSLAEGDLIRYFRQIIDVEEQILNALYAVNITEDLEKNMLLREKIKEAKAKINKSFVEVVL